MSLHKLIQPMLLLVVLIVQPLFSVRHTTFNNIDQFNSQESLLSNELTDQQQQQPIFPINQLQQVARLLLLNEMAPKLTESDDENVADSLTTSSSNERSTKNIPSSTSSFSRLPIIPNKSSSYPNHQIDHFSYLHSLPSKRLYNLRNIRAGGARCLKRGSLCDPEATGNRVCCQHSACRCNLWGDQCRCQRMGLLQRWG